MTEISKPPRADASSDPSFLERSFELTRHGTNVRTEFVAGLTTFLTMVYIVFVNPAIPVSYTHLTLPTKRIV